MENNEDKLNELQDQYEALVEEEDEEKRKKIFWILLFCLILVFLSLFLATYSYYRIYDHSSNFNIDTNGDGKADLNIDINNDGICDINCDVKKDKKPD